MQTSLRTVPVSTVPSGGRRPPDFLSLFHKMPPDVLALLPVLTSDESVNERAVSVPPVHIVRFQEHFTIASSGVSLPKAEPSRGSRDCLAA